MSNNNSIPRSRVLRLIGHSSIAINPSLVVVVARFALVPDGAAHPATLTSEIGISDHMRANNSMVLVRLAVALDRSTRTPATLPNEINNPDHTPVNNALVLDSHDLDEISTHGLGEILVLTVIFTVNTHFREDAILDFSSRGGYWVIALMGAFSAGVCTAVGGLLVAFVWAVIVDIFRNLYDAARPWM